VKDILVFQHDPFEELGNFANVLKRNNLNFHLIRLFQHEIPTQDWDEIGALVILGGSMDVHDEGHYPFLRWEKSLIRTALREGLPILGICMGARLMAEAAGAGVYRSGLKEIGWYPVSLTAEALSV